MALMRARIGTRAGEPGRDQRQAYLATPHRTRRSTYKPLSRRV